MELHVSFMFCTVIAISQLARSPEQYRERILFLGSLLAKMAQRHSFTETGPGSKIRLVLVRATYPACTQSEGTFHSSSPPSNLSTRFPSRRRAANFKSNLFPCQTDPRAMNTVTTMYKVSVPIYIYRTHTCIGRRKNSAWKRFQQTGSIFFHTLKNPGQKNPRCVQVANLARISPHKYLSILICPHECVINYAMTNVSWTLKIGMLESQRMTQV